MYDEPFAGLDPISMGVTTSLIRDLNDALGSTRNTAVNPLMPRILHSVANQALAK